VATTALGMIRYGYDVTFGEMDPADKHEITHRAVAFRKLTKACLED